MITFVYSYMVRFFFLLPTVPLSRICLKAVQISSKCLHQLLAMLSNFPYTETGLSTKQQEQSQIGLAAAISTLLHTICTR